MDIKIYNKLTRYYSAVKKSKPKLKVGNEIIDIKLCAVALGQYKLSDIRTVDYFCKLRIENYSKKHIINMPVVFI